MRYENVRKAIFLERPNRFIAHCLLEGEPITAHVKNTGRCKELLVPGATVYLAFADPARQASRRTLCDLIAVEKGDRLINMDSQAPNQVFYEALLDKKITLPLQPNPLSLIRRESVYLGSRFDFYVEAEEGDWRAYIEIKGVTLEEDGVVLFPDAPTERGVKHLQELVQAKQAGLGACVVFVVHMEGVWYFTPNEARHPAFAQALRTAAEAGVEVLAYDCLVTVDTLALRNPIEVRLQ